MRGKLFLFRGICSPCRITPADAGKTMSAVKASVIVWDHPRGCGENCTCDAEKNAATGSPPRMRGKLSKSTIASANRRITPADAGKTDVGRSQASCRQDHPRGCGENQKLPKQQVMLSGSPPRMRGKRGRCTKKDRRRRITPADAGKTVFFPFLRFWVQDHPRGCGENSQFPAQISRASGSPPRMRGKPSTPLDQRADERITPADAGKTKPLALLYYAYADHPRGCGENITLANDDIAIVGSPPRMRGKH